MPEYKGIQLDLSRDKLFSEDGINLLNRYYSDGEEGVQRAIARAANCFSYGDKELAQFIYDAASKHWFFYSSPILSNAVEGEWVTNGTHKDRHFWEAASKGHRLSTWHGEVPRAMPIACFLSYCPDTIHGQINTAAELSLLSVAGGGAALHSRIRAVTDKAPGPIPYIKTIDGIMGYYRQGKTRRGSVAAYLDISHPDILEFIKMRTPSGGDPARKINNRAGVHNAINITRAFSDAVRDNLLWELRCPHSDKVYDKLPARELWEAILETRELTGEPYLWFIDNVNDKLPLSQLSLGLKNNGSNLCSEISLPTDTERTAVCCLSSLNLERYDEWKDTPLVENLVRFLDNVLQWFIDYAPDELERAKFSAYRERAIGIGAMGWHNFLMKNDIPFESGGFNSAAQWNHKIFSSIHGQGIQASLDLGAERGEAPDMFGTGRRNSHVFAIAPNANSSVLCNTSPSIEPIFSNAYPQKSRAGIQIVKNRYLEKKLEWYGLNEPAVWKSIADNGGSVQHLSFLTQHEKNVFKTATEIDQRWLIEHAEARQPYICQAQSLNLFFAPGSDRAYINAVHLKALYSNVLKSLYYFRTGSAEMTDTIKDVQRQALVDWKEDDGECVSCQG